MHRVLTGRTAAVSLPALLQLCEGEALSGILSLGSSGRVELHEGRPVAAECEGHQGRTALLELFLVDAEEFHLDQGPVSVGPPLVEVIEAVMEGCRLADEWARLAGRAVERWSGETDGDVARLLRAAGDQFSLDQARADLGLARVRCVDPLLALVEQGRLRLGQPPQRVDYYAALEEGREHLRSRDYEQAEAAFRAALAVRPDDRVAHQNLVRVRQLREAGNGGFIGAAARASTGAGSRA